MPNPLLLDIILYFKSKSLVEDDGIDAFRDFTPEKPDNLVALHEYRGSPSIPQDPRVHRSVQVTVRDLNADTSRQRAVDLFQALYTTDETRRIDFTPDRWGQVYLRQPPFRMKMDENNRTVYCFNVGITTTIN